jgi:hypothetical protein
MLRVGFGRVNTIVLIIVSLLAVRWLGLKPVPPVFWKAGEIGVSEPSEMRADKLRIQLLLLELLLWVTQEGKLGTSVLVVPINPCREREPLSSPRLAWINTSFGSRL